MFSTSLLSLLFLGLALAQEYAEDQTPREQQIAPNYARQPYNDPYENARAEPYDFGFQSTDEFGTIMNRQESSDNNGAVRGSYGYTDPFGVFRHVDYVADEYGFRAEVKSNEPGMGTQSPANVQIYAEPPPAGVIVERPYYHPHHHPHVAQGGQTAGQQPSRRNPASAASNANRQTRPATATRIPVATSNTRSQVYPYVPPAQNAFSSNAVGQYPQTVSSQYAANNGAAAASSNGQYPASSAYQPSGPAYRNPYLTSHGYASQTSSQVRTASSSASSSSAQTPIVAKPYDGPTYKIGNPHVTDLVRAEKEESGSVLLPTVVATGGVPTLVKHIHTYPAAPTA